MQGYDNADIEYNEYSYIGRADGIEYVSWAEAIEANPNN